LNRYRLNLFQLEIFQVMAELNLAKYLAPRQKRLQYWRASFKPSGLPEEAKSEISTKLTTYSLLLAKLSRPGSEAELLETRDKLEKLEQQLGTLFELKLSLIGRLSVPNAPETIVLKPK